MKFKVGDNVKSVCKDKEYPDRGYLNMQVVFVDEDPKFPYDCKSLGHSLRVGAFAESELELVDNNANC